MKVNNNSVNGTFLELNIAISRKKYDVPFAIEQNDRKCQLNKNPEN